ncbi:DUF3102 domain-containing protein [Brevibacillus centrosporus]|uniref:DUF3102 domain-containing protein n=1 Tax=Brevibacillus centrosporus TaxID=54910 RepID=UPI003D1D6E44
MSELMTRTADIIAAEINGIKEQTKTMVLLSSIEIGKRLVEAKSMVSHGSWGNWLQEHVDYSQSTANNLMKLYNEYGSNPQAFGNLSYTQAVALLAVPIEEREVFVTENKVEGMSTRELQKAIKEKQELEEKLRETEEQARKEREEREKLDQSYKALESKNKEHDELVRRLQRELENAKQSGDDEEVENLQRSLDQSKHELSQAKEKVKELEKQLNEKPIEVSAVVEKIPEEVQKELEDLRKKVKQNDNKPVIKFTYCFETLVDGFKELLSALEEIKEADPEEHEKYRNAVKGLMGKMSERIEH